MAQKKRPRGEIAFLLLLTKPNWLWTLLLQRAF